MEKTGEKDARDTLGEDAVKNSNVDGSAEKPKIS